MVGFERLHVHGPLPASAHLEWPFLTDGHRHLAQALYAWLETQPSGAPNDWGAALRAAGWPGLATDLRGRAVLAEALAAHHADAALAAQALFAPAAALGEARRVARQWRLALTPDQQEQEATLACLGRLEASQDAAALGVYRAAWQLDRHANDATIDEAAHSHLQAAEFAVRFGDAAGTAIGQRDRGVGRHIGDGAMGGGQVCGVQVQHRGRQVHQHGFDTTVGIGVAHVIDVAQGQSAVALGGVCGGFEFEAGNDFLNVCGRQHIAQVFLHSQRCAGAVVSPLHVGDGVEGHRAGCRTVAVQCHLGCADQQLVFCHAQVGPTHSHRDAVDVGVAGQTDVGREGQACADGVAAKVLRVGGLHTGGGGV